MSPLITAERPAAPTAPQCSPSIDRVPRAEFLAPSEADFEPLLPHSGSSVSKTKINANTEIGRNSRTRFRHSKDAARRKSVGLNSVRDQSTYSNPELSCMTEEACQLTPSDDLDGSDFSPSNQWRLHCVNPSPGVTRSRSDTSSPLYAWYNGSTSYPPLGKALLQMSISNHSSPLLEPDRPETSRNAVLSPVGSIEESCQSVKEEPPILQRSYTDSEVHKNHIRSLRLLALATPSQDSSIGDLIPSTSRVCVKGAVASPETTCIDVHVLAISQRRTSSKAATPPSPQKLQSGAVAQFLEQPDDIYELFLDAADSEEDTEGTPKSTASDPGPFFSPDSPIDPELETTVPIFVLERANTKLAVWSWNNEMRDSNTTTPPQLHNISIENQSPFGINLEEIDEILLVAPPNSTRPSRNPSRHPSVPPTPNEWPHLQSPPFGFNTSHTTRDYDGDSDYSDDSSEDSNQEDLPSDPHGRKRSRHESTLGSGSRAVRRSHSAPRKLSNLNEEEVHFAGHRDSLTLARHMLQRKGIPVDRYGHRDSVALTKVWFQKKKQSAVNAVAIRPPELWSPHAPLHQGDSPVQPATIARPLAAPAREQEDAPAESRDYGLPFSRHIRILDAGKVWNGDRTSLTPPPQ